MTELERIKVEHSDAVVMFNVARNRLAEAEKNLVEYMNKEKGYTVEKKDG